MNNSSKKKKFSFLKIITESFRIYRNNFKRILLIILLLVVPLYVLSFILPASLIIDLDPFVHYDDFSEMNRVSTQIEIIKRFTSILLGILITAYIIIGAVYITKENYNGKDAFLRGFFRSVRKFSFKFLLLSLVFGILFIPGLFMFFIPSVIIWIFFGFSFLAIIVNKAGIIDSMKLSMKITANNFVLTMGCWIMLLLISLLLNPYLYLSIDFTSIYTTLLVIAVGILLQFYPLIFLTYFYMEIIASIPLDQLPKEFHEKYDTGIAVRGQ